MLLHSKPVARAASIGLALLLASVAQASLPPGTGMLLPIQDRVGDRGTARVVERTLSRELLGLRRSADTHALRDALRRLRLRNIDTASPKEVDALAAELGVDWFLSCHLHEAIPEPVPQITLSGRIYRPGTDELVWAGFEAGSGLDSVRWLGRGGTSFLDELAEEVTLRLIEQLRQPSLTESPKRGSSRAPEPARHGFLRHPVSHAGLVIAVVPFDSLADQGSGASADIVTQAALATLHQRGFRLLSPNRVSEIQRVGGRFWRGALDPGTRSSLAEDAGVDAVLTGTVEIYVPERGLAPRPRVAVSARLLDTRTGLIQWINGLERSGWDGERLFEKGRVYSAGALAQDVVRSLVASFDSAAGHRKEGER